MVALSVFLEGASSAIREAEAPQERPGKPVSGEAPTDVPAVLDGLAEARARLQAAAAHAGVSDEDPLGPVLNGLSDVLGAVATITAEHASRLETFQVRAGDLAQLVIDRAKTELAAAASVTIERIASAIAASADAALVKRVRVFDRNTALAATGILFASIGTAADAGYLCGRAVARSDIVETEQNLAAAFRAGAGGASAWLTLMTANDPTQALAECHGPALWIDKATGRRACRVPLWLDAVPPTVPNERSSQ